ncbi:hypothetical protein JHD50_02970 [Sulfurimonas sp. MAG313]|nr:hypothetical protein [Sulfurimonas sp. MAG313]MDF1880274.1 hypothetical protein [Sulfurimonas sp. MAG313]
MTYVKSTDSRIKIFSTALWLSFMVLVAFTSPLFLIPVSLLALSHIAYLLINPMPLPIVLSFVCMVSLSFYAVYMKVAVL